MPPSCPTMTRWVGGGGGEKTFLCLLWCGEGALAAFFLAKLRTR